LQHTHKTTEQVSYVCSSHCWDNQQLLMTTKQNIDGFHGTISWDPLPKES
ncbi:hypothetical protein B0J11DRAFT_446821, partial [Dendryphion nanum]